MSDPREVVARAHGAANVDDHEGHLQHYTEDAVTTTPGNQVGGRDTIGEFSKNWQDACPDAHVVVVSQVAEGDRVAEEFVFAGTHTRTLVLPSGTVPPTNRSVLVHGAIFMRIEGDRIASERVYLDESEFLAQLGLKVGAVPGPDVAGAR